MNDRFTFSGKHKMSILIMAGIGLVLLVSGYLISLTGGGHHAPAAAADSSATSSADVLRLASADPHLYADASGQEHAEEHKKEEHAEGGHSAAAHGGGHDGPDLYDTHAPNGAWVRAPLHEGQFKPAAHHEAPGAIAKIGSIMLMAGFWFVGISIFGIFFQAFSFVANAGWHIAFKRIPETFYKFIPFAAVLLIGVWFLKDFVWSHWAPSEIRDPNSAHFDEMISNKWPVLDPMFLLATMLIFPVVWWLFGNKLRQNSLKEDTQGGIALFKNSFRVSAGFLPVFAVTFCLAAFQWLMSLDPHWFSTIYAVYCFATIVVSGFTIMTLITVYLKERGYLPEVNANHLHDLAKYMFAFSIFWTYLWISQYLLIWYANIPEETIYFYNRFKDYEGLFFFNLLINFAFPFLAFMTRKAKRQVASIKIIGWGILFGRFIDMFLLVIPGVMGGEWSFGLLIMALGMFVLMGAAFLFVVFNAISKAPLAAKNHPYFEESVHHTTGV